MACQPTNNNDLRSFGEVFAEEHLKQGGNGSFWYKGKKFSTKRSDGRDLRKERLAKDKNASAASCHCVGSNNNNNNNSVTKPEMECKQTMLDLKKEKNIKDICAIISSIAYDGLYKTPKSKYNSTQRRENSFSKCINVNGYKGLIDENFEILYSNQDMFGVKMHGKIFVGFRGTVMTNVRDIGNDLINIGLNTRKGFGKRHNTCSKLLKNEIIDKYGNNNNNNNNIILTGHSLGGHLAESLAIEYDLYAYTFNAPGINITSKIMFGGHSNNNVKKSDKIYSYKIKGDLIGTAGESLGKNVIFQEQSDAAKGLALGKHALKNFLPDAGQCFEKITTQLDRQIVQEVGQY